MFNLLAKIREIAVAWWTAHGTKILGFWTAAITTVSLIDHETVNVIQTTLGEVWAHAILIVSGLATAYRGFTNTAKQNGSDGQSH